MIRFSRVTKQYPAGHIALRDLTFTIETNKMTFLTGHSGAGKSTLIKLITLQERASRGRVYVNDRNLSELSGNNVAYYRRTIGVVHQDHKLLNDRTVEDNIALPLVVRNTERSIIRRNTAAALEMVNLQGKEKVYPMQLSGGEQQRVGIARAIVGRPNLIIADEPTGNLDAELGESVMAIFHNLVHYDTTVLVATHDPRHYSERNYPVLELYRGTLRTTYYA